MDGTNVNGGNAKVARDVSNLNSVSMPDLQESENKTAVADTVADTATDMDGQEVNGDLKGSSKKTPSTAVKTKLRKFKANSTSSIENDVSLSTTRGGRKRKLSEPDDASSEESTEFNGFDLQGIDEFDTGSHVLKKLIAEAEIAEAQLTKRCRYLVPKKNFDGRKDDDQDSDDNKIRIYDMEQVFDIDKIKKERESDTDSIGIANSIELEMEQQKTEESSIKSVNSSSTTSSPSAISLKSKGGRISRGASPGSALKQKGTIDMSNPAFKEPFKYGWKRELVFRASNDSSLKRMADIYYYTPKGKKVRSFREVAECLHSRELTIDNFTFFKEPIGIDDPEKEIIRDAKRIRGSIGSAPTPPRRSFGTKKVMTTRKPIEEHVPASSPAPAVAVPQPAVSTTPAKTAARSPKTPSSFKVKVPAKKTPQITEIKTSSEEREMLPPQRNAASTRRSQQPVEKALPVKSKRLLTPKVQEPCSIRCSTSMGLIPSLQCRVCLCLYHPECVDGLEFSGSDDYICKNCQQDSTETHQHQSMNPSLTPPPLIPISMLGTQNAKQKPQTSLTPPKLQRIPKSENADIQSRSANKFSKIATTSSTSPSEKKEDTWFPQSENEFLQSHDGILPKPAQNIALMGGKRYIVVPKNNAMAVQPAITVKPDKIGDKPPMLQESSLIDVSNTMENSTITNIGISSSTKISGANDTTESVYDKELSKDVPASCGSSDGTNETLDSNTNTNTSLLESQILNAKAYSSIETRKTSTRSPNKKPMSSMAIQNNISTFGIDSEVTRTDIKQIVINTNIVQMGNRRKQNQQESNLQHHFMDNVCAGYHALLRIFQYLKVQELLRAARVCKMWRDLAAHPSLWKTVRMKNSQVTDWDGLADTLQRHGTQHLDLRKMLVAGESDSIWRKFLSVIPRVTSLVKLELCRCPVMVVEEVIKSCPQLQVLSAMTIKCDSLNLQSVGNLKHCQELRLKAISGMSLQEDLIPLKELTQLTQLSLTSVKELGKKRIDIIQTLINLETLELGECSDFPDKFGTSVLIKLQKLERLRLEKGQGSCCTFDILEGVSKLENLNQMELVNFDVKNGFDKCLANCKNIKRLLIIPTYISQSATSNNMVLGGVTELSHNLTHFVWGVTLELLRVTELFVDQCNLMNKQVTGDSIPVLKPVPCLKLIEDVEDENDNQKGEDKQLNMTSPQVDILPLPQLQKLLLTALPKTRVKILKIPFHATWRQSISDTTTQ
ncbi:nucleolar protein dao-5 isoform X1 [Vespula squamosa]|uniref:Nucleolar protein dao-5 isoform X1 n=1 Tax=Vespula squamosa TaxID=30214 RepID=A0ABD2AXH8_VESSQ